MAHLYTVPVLCALPGALRPIGRDGELHSPNPLRASRKATFSAEHVAFHEAKYHRHRR